MTSLQGVAPDPPPCTCGQDPHRASCMVVAWTQPHAMVSDRGEVFYPYSRGDAWELASLHRARPLRPDVFPYELDSRSA